MSDPVATDEIDEPSDGDQIRLSLPARHEYARVARIAIAALAPRLGFTYREVEDLRLAIDESLILLLGVDRPDERITIRFGTEHGHVELHASTGFEPEIDPDARARFEALAGDLVDDWRLSDDGRELRLTKRHRSATDD
ncbi:MAG TPA: anti-sigma regulatory factor [Actinomycetota bacterium]